MPGRGSRSGSAGTAVRTGAAHGFCKCLLAAIRDLRLVLFEASEDSSSARRHAGAQVAEPRETRGVVRFAKIDGAADRGMHFRASKLLVANLLPDCAFDECGPCQVKAGAFGHHEFVAQDGKVTAAGDTVPHDRRNLRNPHG